MEERRSTAEKKKRIIELLLEGESPGKAAKGVKTTRAQAYVWKSKDAGFSAKWDDAVQTGLDLLESSVFKRAIDGSDAMATLLLKCRRPEVYNRPPPPPEPVVDPIQYRITTVREAVLRIEQLGLRPMQINGDFEDGDQE